MLFRSAGLGNYDEAERLLIRAQQILEKNFGTHPMVATGLDNLADFYEGIGRTSEAQALRARAAELRSGKGK